MTWKKLLAEKRVAVEASSADEIARLLELARRNLGDASVEMLSDDGRFDCAYGAARALATVIVRAEGYRIKQPAAHYNTFLALDAADRNTFEEFATYFDTCRKLRNELSYDAPDVVTETELAEIIDRVTEFEVVVAGWLKARHPELTGGGEGESGQ